MYFYGYFLINFFIPLKRAEQLHEKISSRQSNTAAVQKRDPVLPGWIVLHVIAGSNLWKVYNTAGIPAKRDKISYQLTGIMLSPPKVVIKWSRLAGMKFQPVQPGQVSPYDYMWKSDFAPARQDSFPPSVCLDLHAFSLNFS